MQVKGSKNGGCLAMTQVRVVVSTCVVTAIAVILFLSLNFGREHCGQQDDVYTFLKSLDISAGKQSTSIPSKEEKHVSGTACETIQVVQPVADMCLRDWEKPSVVNEREVEKLDDENTPEVQRTFTPLGVAAFLFVQFGAYRGSPNNFSIVGLVPKSLHVYGNPGFKCYWFPKLGGEPIVGNATAYLPGLSYSIQYTGTVIHCQFEKDVGADGTGGSLQLIADMGSQDLTGLSSAHFIALTENEGEFDRALFEQPLKYDHVYCGTPIYGNISPQRVREWMAYHARLFGPRTLFMLYDAGGLHDDVRKILAPWVKLGRVSITNVRQEMRYEVFYHSQVMVLNDCLMQAKRIAEFAFFFDIDEYLYVPPPLNLTGVMRQIVEERGRLAQQVTFDQRPMNHDHCVKRPENDSDERFQSLWGIEKLVFERTQVTENGGWKDHKYAVQTKYILVANVHDHEISFLQDGLNIRETITYQGCDKCLEDKLHYLHFHNTISIREELCKVFVDPSVKETKFDNVTHVYDDELSSLADAVRQYELETVGSQPFII